jgi:hypothetical protein
MHNSSPPGLEQWTFRDVIGTYPVSSPDVSRAAAYRSALAQSVADRRAQARSGSRLPGATVRAEVATEPA